MEEYSELTRRKIQLYFAANYLYARGSSHPQVVKILSEFETNQELLVSVADAAMVDKWRTIFNESQRLLSVGKNFQEVISEVSPMESDPEVLHFICNLWYQIQSVYAESIIESPTNILEGAQWTLISSLALTASFYFKASLIPKIIWSVVLVASLITWMHGLYQKKLSNELQKILAEDFTKFGKLI